MLPHLTSLTLVTVLILQTLQPVPSTGPACDSVPWQEENMRNLTSWELSPALVFCVLSHCSLAEGF